MKADAQVEREIREVLARFDAALAARDATALTGLFAPDADIVLIGSEEGERFVGPDQVRQLFARITGQYDRLAWSWGWTSISARGDVAWLSAESVVQAQIGAQRFAIPYRLSAVFEKRDGRWWWMQYHGSEPARPGEG
jgi:uncharacterized protein (TIGR02246 family)